MHTFTHMHTHTHAHLHSHTYLIYIQTYLYVGNNILRKKEKRLEIDNGIRVIIQ